MGSPNATTVRPGGDQVGLAGAAEQLHATFTEAAAAADRAVGLWLARHPNEPTPHDSARNLESDGDELLALRALVRAAATAYARQLRAHGTAPERMLVLVKAAAAYQGSPGFGAQELTNDIVRWSIEAYYDD
jgi:hypothetical protein